MTNFNQQIADFKNYGTYNYIFDSVGNEVLNPSSSIFQQVYFALPLKNYNYNDSKILSFYNPLFTEFIPTSTGSTIPTSVLPQETIDQINSITYQNIQLQNQLDNLVSSNEQNTGSADIQLVKDTIINLRIQLAQGLTSADFFDIFPYDPIPLESQNLSPLL